VRTITSLFKAESFDVTVFVGWVMICFALYFLALNVCMVIANFSFGTNCSQVYVVPLLAWSPAVMLSKEAYFFSSIQLEFLVLLGVHVATALVAVWVSKRNRVKYGL
jgi:hypothetical protein